MYTHQLQIYLKGIYNIGNHGLHIYQIIIRNLEKNTQNTLFAPSVSYDLDSTSRLFNVSYFKESKHTHTSSFVNISYDVPSL